MRILILLSILFLATFVSGQDLLTLEQDLAFHADVMMSAQNSKHRIKAAKDFQTLFEKTLSIESSYFYPFDSLIWISKKQPKDNTFRIFTWIVDNGNGQFDHIGFIQLPTGKIFTLKDHLKDSEDWEYSINSNENWMGAMYYSLLEDVIDGKKQYLLFGFHRFDVHENIKLLDVLSFDKQENPLFGKEIFERKNKDARSTIKTRIVLKYSADSYVGLHFNDGLNLIVHDHLITKANLATNRGMTLVSDGSLVGYEKNKNYWTYIDKLYTQILDEAPRPQPILDKRSKDLFGKDKK
ncbi:MAG: hypothetical protein WAT79_02545 [Saprospiraceae bacterium]